MTAYATSTEAPPGWSNVCRDNDALFHSAEWLALLETSFGGSTMYTWDVSARRGAALSLFRAGPFRIAYLGFPNGGTLAGALLDESLFESWRRSRTPRPPVAVRLPVSAFAHPVDLDLPFVSVPETAIIDLSSWTIGSTTKDVQRDVKKAAQSVLELHDATGVDDAARMFDLYSATIRRHRGSLRYTKAYFENLVELARMNSRIRCMIAQHSDSLAGFTVVARHEGAGFYLHAGSWPSYRDHRPSAMLLNAAIEWARDSGCTRFNLMASPATQPTLVKYKEKWGAETRPHRTYTLALRPAYRVFRLAEKLYRALR